MDLRYKLKTAPVFYPIVLSDLKTNLRILTTDQDTLLQSLIYTAIDDAQTMTGRQFARATYTAYLDAYPSSGEIEIDRGPVDAITTVKYYAPGAVTLTTLASTKYQLDNVELTARLRFLESFSVDKDKMNVIEIEFTAGWVDMASIPSSIKDAVILLASERYLNPGNAMLNFGSSIRVTAAERLLRKIKIQRY